MLLSCNMQYFILEQLQSLDYLKSFGLSSEVLKNINIDINKNLSLDRTDLVVKEIKGVLNLIKEEYIISVERKLEEEIIHTGVIYDKNFDNDPVIFDLI